MGKGDNARNHEQTARAEIIQRIALRDNALVLYLGAVGALLSFAGTANNGTEILLIIPYLGFGATTIIEHHHMMIGVISHYLAVDLDSQYRKLKEFVPQWDNSPSARDAYSKRPYFLRRIFAHWILIAVPSMLSLIVNYKYFWSTSLLTVAFWFGLILTILSMVTIAQSSAYRRTLRPSEPADE